MRLNITRTKLLLQIDALLGKYSGPKAIRYFLLQAQGNRNLAILNTNYIYIQTNS